MADRELETLIARKAALRRGATNGNRGQANTLMRLQGMVGNSAVTALLQRAPCDQKITPASIAEALSKVKVTTQKKTVHELEPWEIYRLVTANTPKKKTLYKELHQAWAALEAAKKKLTANPAPATASSSATPAVARSPKGKHHAKAPADPAAAHTAAQAAVDAAQKRVDKAIAAIKEFILEDNDLLRKVRAEERSIQSSLKRARAQLSKLKAKKHKADDKGYAQQLSDSEAAVTKLEKNLAEIPKRREEATEEVKKKIAATSFSPEDVQRTIYTYEIEGESVTLSDRVDSWATKYENGLVEADRAVQTKLDDVLSGTTLSESNKKILRAISDNESGGAPWSSVNTYDRAVLTWGLVQWTGGSHSDLTAALTTIKTVAPDSFRDRFEKYGIDVIDDELVITGADGSTTKGNDAALGIMGSPTLSAVMSRAGLDSKIQQAEVAAAAQQQIIGPLGESFDVTGPPPGEADKSKDKDKDAKATDKDKAPKKKGDKTRLRYSQVLTSEYVVGLFADQVVNSGKGTTQKRVAAAVQAFINSKKVDPGNPSAWVAELQDQLIALLSPFKNRAVPFGKRGASKTIGSYKS